MSGIETITLEPQAVQYWHDLAERTLDELSDGYQFEHVEALRSALEMVRASAGG